MKNILSVMLWVPALAAKFLLAAVGLVVVPFTDSKTNTVYGNREDPFPPHWYRPGQPERWRDYAWRALRNPVNNLRYLIREPVWLDVATDNPDTVVRTMKRISHYRWTRSDLFSEFWYLRRVGFNKYFEFRIGWKFSGVPGFAPTFQLGIRSR